MKGLKNTGTTCACALAILPFLAIVAASDATDLIGSTESNTALCKVQALDCASDELAALDPPNDITYTTRAPVATPRLTAQEPSKHIERNAARRATIDVPDREMNDPKEIGQNPD